MAIWPLYTYDHVVACEKCEQSLAPARDGMIIGFGDGNGNREQTCPSCGWKTHYDVTKSAEKARRHADEHRQHFDAQRAHMRVFWGLEKPSANDGPRARSSSRRGGSPARERDTQTQTQTRDVFAGVF